MNRLLIILLVLCFERLQAQGHRFVGTWVNTEIYDAVQRDGAGVDLNGVLPRCIYIDLANKMTIEFRFEQKSATSAITGISKKGDSVFFTALGRNFAIANDGIMVLFNRVHNLTFKKINDQGLLGSGIQALLRSYYWASYKQWKVEIFADGALADTVVASIGAQKISGSGDTVLFRQYEFTELKRYYVKGKPAFGIVLFSVNDKNMSYGAEVFAIRKTGRSVSLYKDDQLVYRLSPIE